MLHFCFGPFPEVVLVKAAIKQDLTFFKNNNNNKEAANI